MRRPAAAVLALSLTLSAGFWGAAGAAHAGPASDEMGRCLVHATTDQDKTALMVWIFQAVSAHPTVRAYANVTDAQRQESAKAAAAILQRLLTVDCRKESSAAVKADGPAAFQTALAGLGPAVMEGLTQDPAVGRTLQQVVGYLDMAKLGELMQ